MDGTHLWKFFGKQAGLKSKQLKLQKVVASLFYFQILHLALYGFHQKKLTIIQYDFRTGRKKI